MTPMTLYDATSDLVAINDTLEALADAPAEERDRIEAELAPRIEAAIRRVDDFGRSLRSLDAQAEFASAEIKRLQERKKGIEALREKLTDRAIVLMEREGLKKLQGNTVTLTLAAKPASVAIIDESILPPQFVRIVQTTSPDKVAIKAALNAGETVPGADLTIGGNSLRIK